MSAVRALAWREWLIRFRNPIFPLWDLVAPLAYLAIFGASFEKWMPPGATPGGYGRFFLAGVLGMVTVVIAWNSSYAFFEDLRAGVFHELLTFPFPRRDLLLGKLVFNLLFSFASALLCVLAARFALGVRPAPGALALALLATLVAMAAWTTLYFWLALVMRGFNAYQTTTSALYLVVMFLSDMFYPLEMLPAPLRALAAWNPASWQIGLTRALLDGRAPSGWHVGGTIGFLIVVLVLAERRLNATHE